MSIASKMTAVANKIRSLLNIEEKLSLDEMTTNLSTLDAEADEQTELITQITTALKNKTSVDLYNEGYTAANEAFWNLIQIKEAWVSGQGWVRSVTNNYAHCFKNWYTATEINPLYPIETDLATSNMFESCQNIQYHPPITFLKAVSTYAMFNGCRKLKEANGEFRLTGNCAAMFNSCGELTKVNKLIIEGTVTWSSNAFAGCNKLEEVNIEGVIDTAFYINKSPLLNKASITNIMNILSDSTSGLYCVFAKAAINKAFETSEGANDGSTSTEWQALVNNKSNWTIALE